MTREEVNQALNELCQYGGMVLGGRHVEAIKIAAIFYETGEDTATREEKSCENCKNFYTTEDQHRCCKVSTWSKEEGCVECADYDHWEQK